MSIIDHNASPVNSDLYDAELDGPSIIFDQGPFGPTYLYGIDEGSIPSDADHDEWHALFDVTEDDRSDYRQFLAESDEDWHTFDDDSDTEVCEPITSLVEALEGLAAHYDEITQKAKGIIAELAHLAAIALREKAAEGRHLGSPVDLDTWEDREATIRGWAG